MHSDRLELIGSTIRYYVEDAVEWEVPIESIQVIGEMTTDAGPFIDDYFLCFADSPGRWYQASFYSEGRDELLRSLETLLRVRFSLRLAGSTAFNSNILWPACAANRPMFAFQSVDSPFWGRVFGLASNRQFFSDEALVVLVDNVWSIAGRNA